MTRLLMSGVAVAALVAFGSMADAQQAQPPVQTMPNQGAGSGPDTGAGGAAGAGAQTQGGGAGAGAQTQMPQDSQSGQSQQSGQKSSDSMEKSSDTKKKSSDTMQKQSEETKGGDKTKKQSQSGEESSGATGATGKAGKIAIPEGRRSQVAKSFSSHKVKSVDIDVDVSVGVAVPRTVVLHPVPVDIVEIVPAFRHYRYFVLANGEIVIVDPATFVVVYVIAA
jgi:Protein of unknown function (DUF1236)